MQNRWAREANGEKESDARGRHIYFRLETNSNDWKLEGLKADAKLTE
jgi:hypothetical protein